MANLSAADFEPERHQQIIGYRHSLLPALFAVDLALCMLHVVRWLGWSTNDRFLLQMDGGIGEWWQYAQAAAISVLLALMARRSRQPVYAAWALVFLYALLDDALMIHERGGAAFARRLAFEGAFGLRAVDFGELLVSALAGGPLMAFCWWAHRRGNALARAHSMILLGLFGMLLFFGIVVDMVHIALESAGMKIEAMNIIEDGGELFAMSLVLAFAFRLRRTANAGAARPWSRAQPGRRFGPR